MKRLLELLRRCPSGTGLDHLAKAYPDRFFDVGIAEEHAVLMAGMAAKVCIQYAEFTQLFCSVHTIKLSMMSASKIFLSHFV